VIDMSALQMWLAILERAGAQCFGWNPHRATAISEAQCRILSGTIISNGIIKDSRTHSSMAHRPTPLVRFSADGVGGLLN
jgi:hypothetical protein